MPSTTITTQPPHHYKIQSLLCHEFSGSKKTNTTTKGHLFLHRMSTIEMASVAPKFAYQRLRNEGMFDDFDGARYGVMGRTKGWSRPRKFPSRKKLRIRIPSLRRFLRRKAKMVSAVRVSFGRILKRLKDSRAHFADLFAGNYLFLQVNPTPLKFIVDKSYVGHSNIKSLASRYAIGENC